VLRTAEALTKAPLGWGMGYASVGTRHVMPGGQALMLVENYITKLAYEMGWFGLVTFFWLVGASLVQGMRCYRQCATPEARYVTGCLAIFVSGLLILSFAGTLLDKIPVNVYFWFFLGVMLKVPQMQAVGAEGLGPAAPYGPQAAPRPVRGGG